MNESKSIFGRCPCCNSENNKTFLIVEFLKSVFGNEYVEQTIQTVSDAIDNGIDGDLEPLGSMGVELGDEPNQIGYWFTGDPEKDLLIPLMVGYFIQDRNTGDKSMKIIEQLFNHWGKTDLAIEDKKKIIMNNFDEMTEGQKAEEWPYLVRNKYVQLSNQISKHN